MKDLEDKPKYYIIRINDEYYTVYRTLDEVTKRTLYCDVETDDALYSPLDDERPRIAVNIIPLAPSATKEEAIQYTNNIINGVHTDPEKIKTLFNGTRI